MRPVVVSQTGVGTATVVPVDYLQNRFLVGVGVVVSGTVTYSVQHTYDDVLNPAVTPTWFTATDFSAKTVSFDGSYISPIRGLRLNVTAGTGTATMTVLQGDPR